MTKARVTNLRVVGGAGRRCESEQRAFPRRGFISGRAPALSASCAHPSPLRSSCRWAARGSAAGSGLRTEINSLPDAAAQASPKGQGPGGRCVFCRRHGAQGCCSAHGTSLLLHGPVYASSAPCVTRTAVATVGVVLWVSLREDVSGETCCLAASRTCVGGEYKPSLCQGS